MSDQSGPPRLRLLFDAALQDYEKQTGIELVRHPLSEVLQSRDSVDSVTSVTTVLWEQTQAFSKFQGTDKVKKLLKNVVSVLYKLSAAADFGRAIGLPVKAIYTGLAILLSEVKGVIDSCDALVDMLESIEHYLNYLDIYTMIPSTDSMTEMVVKILGELLSALALATKQIKDGKPKNLVKKLLGDKGVEAVLQRLDRLTMDEARISAAQTLEVVHGLIQNIRVVMDDGKPSVDHLRDALETMQQIASDLNKSKRDLVQRDTSRWLSPPDPWKNHFLACKSRHRESAAWFIQGNTFSEWKASEAGRSLLWIHGKPGAGKSVFCSTIIEDVDAMRKAGLASLAFFYFDFREDQKTDLRGLLSSLLVQLCHQSDSYCDVLFKFYSEHAEGLLHPGDDALVECLKDLLKLPGLAPVYIIVDALDECPRSSSAFPSPRDKVLNLIEELIHSQITDLRICVTSRPEVDIRDVFIPLTCRSVSLHDEIGQKKDIEEYIKSVINTHPKNRRWKAEHKKLVIDVLTNKADGMFRWVYCQVVYICGTIPARIRIALADLPETLDETYRRTLREINKADWEFAHRLFQFVAMASRPLHVEELADLLAFDFEAGPIPSFHEGWRIEDPVDAVLSTCSSLLTIVDGGNLFGKVIQFSHISVKEFLTSTRLAEATDIIPRRYHISMTRAHTLVARACLGILLHLDEDLITSDGLEEYPLAEYAAEHWVDHARFEDVSRNVEDGMKRLFDPSELHLAVCLWIHNPEFPTRGRTERAERPLPLTGTPLHYAVLWGLYTIVKLLVIGHSQDVNSPDFTNMATPLHLASKYGQVKVGRMLIEHGADVTAQNKDGETPLHVAVQQVEVGRMLIERGADVTAQNKDGETPLHLASQSGQVEVTRMLIERGADVTAQNKDGETPLHLALQMGQVEVARMLIEFGADMMAQNKGGETPLHLASRKGQVEVSGMLIERGADVTVQDKAGWNSIHLALSRGHVELVHMFIEHCAGEIAQVKDKWTPLHRTPFREFIDVAETLFNHGADVTVQDRRGLTPLHLAAGGHVKLALILLEHSADATTQDWLRWTPLRPASFGEHAELTRILLERGVDATAQDKNEESPMHWASSGGDAEIARILFEHGADTDARDNDNCTPLHWASQQGHPEVVRFLLEHGANANGRDNDNCTPLHWASQQGHLEVVRVLIEHGVDADARDSDNCTPLHWASQQGHLEVVRVLVEHRMDINARDHSDWTPLHGASQHGHLEVVQFLLEHGADAHASDQGGWTSLQWPSYNGDPEIVRVLLEHGVDPNARDGSNWTPLHGASQQGHQEVVQVLLEHGADANLCDDSNQTPLHLASRAGHVGLVQLLVESSSNIRVRNDEGRLADLGPPEGKRRSAHEHHLRLPGSFPTGPPTFLDTPPSEEMFRFCHIV